MVHGFNPGGLVRTPSLRHPAHVTTGWKWPLASPWSSCVTGRGMSRWPPPVRR